MLVFPIRSHALGLVWACAVGGRRVGRLNPCPLDGCRICVFAVVSLGVSWWSEPQHVCPVLLMADEGDVPLCLLAFDELANDALDLDDAGLERVALGHPERARLRCRVAQDSHLALVDVLAIAGQRVAHVLHPQAPPQQFTLSGCPGWSSAARIRSAIDQ